MNSKKDPVIIGAALLLCFPLGFFLILRSKIKRSAQIAMILSGFLINIAFLFLALYQPKSPENSKIYEIKIGQESLMVGQSTYISCTSEETIFPTPTIKLENDCLSLSGSVITAEKIGKCNVAIQCGEIQKDILVSVINDEGGKEIVYLTQSGKRYHKKQSHCKKNIITMTQEDAILSGKTPCKNCY